MNAAQTSLAIITAWLAFALLAGPILWSLFLRDRREVGADEAFDTLPDLSEPTPLYDEVLARYDVALWELEFLNREADS